MSKHGTSKREGTPTIRGGGMVLAVLAAALLSVLAAGTAVAATYTGTPGNDLIQSNFEPDIIRGLGGNDDIFADEGDDLANGNEGVDRVFGMEDRDEVYGGPGDDYEVNGGLAGDEVYGNQGADTLVGESGNDTIRTGDDAVSDDVNCGEDISDQETATDFDTAYVERNDLVDGQRAGLLTSTDGLTCERLFVNGTELR